MRMRFLICVFRAKQKMSYFFGRFLSQSSEPEKSTNFFLINGGVFLGAVSDIAYAKYPNLLFYFTNR